MPALWDMHTHPMEPEALSMLVANGVGALGSCGDCRVISNGAPAWSSASCWDRGC